MNPEMTQDSPLPKILVLDQDDIFHFIVDKIFNRESHRYDILDFTNITGAVSYLIEHAENEKELPDVILLELYFHSDQDGWIFLDLYEKIKERLVKQPKVLVVSYTINHTEVGKINSHQSIFDFVSKPLDNESIDLIKSIADKSLKE
jgi:DNA-binding NtrC family response regulator